MLYIILGIVLVVTISAFIGKNKPTGKIPKETGEAEPANVFMQDASSQAQENSLITTTIDKTTDETAESKSDEPMNVGSLVATPLTSPGVSGSTVYSSSGEIIRAPDSVKRDAYGLHWSNRSSELNVNGIILRGAMIYWADGKPGIDEPSCIDITLPFEISDTEYAKDKAPSYAMMTPSQRGGYLTWLAGGRNQIPADPLCITLWFMGIERRALLDKQDITFCVVETLRMLPYIRNEKLYSYMKNLSIWLTVKYMLPEEQILKLVQNMKDAPVEFFNVILGTYSNAKLPLPSYLAYIVMCCSPIARKTAPYNENLINAFALIYKNQTNGGLILKTPNSEISLSYISFNTSISESKRKQEIIVLPDFFVDIMQFKPIINSWNDFIKKYEENCFEDESDGLKIKQIDWEPFIRKNHKEGELHLITKFSSLASFLEIDQSEKPSSVERKEISEIARIEGYLIIPDLCISGKEYGWEDSIALTPIALGEKISDDYSSAALMLEFITALTGENAGEFGGAEGILNKTARYFCLENEELNRLNILPSIFGERTQEPDNLGECLHTWLKTEEREYIRDFVFDMLELSNDPDTAPHIVQISEKLHKLLDVNIETQENITITPETGEKIVHILSDLFKNK